MHPPAPDDDRSHAPQPDWPALVERALRKGIVTAQQADALRKLAADDVEPGLAVHAVAAERRARRRASEAERQFQQEQGALRAERERHCPEPPVSRPPGLLDALRGDEGPGGDRDWLDLVAETDGGGDERDDAALPVLVEHIGWLVGTALVLAGSVYGLRVAWQSFDAAGRWAATSAALTVYHLVFWGGGLALVGRSPRAGRALAAVGAGLLPLVFASLAHWMAVDRVAGGGASGLVALLAAFTLHKAGQWMGSAALALVVLLPSLLVLPGPQLDDGGVVRLALPVAALALPAAVARWTRSLPPAVYGLGVYAALAAGAFALVGDAAGAPESAAMVWRTTTEAGRPWLPLHGVALAWAAWALRHVRAHSEEGRKWLSIGSWLGWSGLLVSAALGCVAVLVATNAPDPRSAAVALAAAAAGLGAAWVAAAAGTAGSAAVLTMATLLAATAARCLAPQPSALPVWLAAGALPALAQLSGLAPWPGRRTGHALGLAVLAVALVWLSQAEPRAGARLPLTTALGAATAVLAHLRGRSAPAWHAVAAALAVATAVLGAGPAADPRMPGLVCVALAVGYGAVGWWQRSRDVAQAAVLEDLSLGLLLVAAVLALPLTNVDAPRWSAWGPQWSLVGFAQGLPFWLAAAGLLVRAPLDQSAVPAMLGVLAASVGLLMAAGARSPGQTMALFAGQALLGMGVAAALTPARRLPALGRRVWGHFELPQAWIGRGAVAQGFGIAAMCLAGNAVVLNVLWCLSDRADRAEALVGASCVALTLLLGFATRAWASFDRRGRAEVLLAFALAVVLVALTNRLGRPLPPLVVARNLTVVGIGLWLLAAGAERVGPRVAAWLGAPEGEGARYPWVAQAGVAALAGLLVLDAWWMPALPMDRGLAVVPPLMLLGPAVLLVLLGRSFRQVWLVVPAFALMCGGAMLAAGQGGVLGIELRAWDPPGGRWMPMDQIPIGGAWGASAVHDYGGPAAAAARWAWSLVGLAGCALGLAVAALLVVRAGHLGDRLARALWRRNHPNDPIWLHVLASLAALLAAAAVFGIALARDGSRFWPVGPSEAGVPATRLALVVAAAACWVVLDAAAALAERHAASAAALIAGLCLAQAGGPWLAQQVGVSPADASLAIGAVCAGLALGHQALAFALRRSMEDHGVAFAAARDLLLVGGAAAVGVWCAADRPDPGPQAAHLGLAALAACAVANGWAFAAERRALHVYLLQSSLLGVYAVLRQTWLRTAGPEDDAAVLLAVGFLLVGATVAARRAGLDHAADAVRRFAGLLPLGMGAALPWQATADNALWSLGAAGMYAVLGRAGGSRAMGALGAVAGNLALLQAALAQGFSGFEVWFGALGLLAVVLSHLYADVLQPGVRAGIRTAGAALGYGPAAVALLWQLGDAQNDWYPLGFAAACLVGVAVGAVLRVRAYLLLGAAFLLLDLATALVRASLRDQRLGFVALSCSGLLVLAAMVLWSTRRAQVQAAVRRVRRVLGRWQ